MFQKWLRVFVVLHVSKQISSIKSSSLNVSQLIPSEYDYTIDNYGDKSIYEAPAVLLILRFFGVIQYM